MNLKLRVANYITRYAPSRQKITEYLTRKKHPSSSDYLTEIGYDESMMCDIWVRSLIATGKSETDIRQKLLKKSFLSSTITSTLEKHHDTLYDWSEYERSIVHQIDTLRSRGKSLVWIRMTLQRTYPYFRDEISELLSGGDDSESLQKEMQKYKNKYTLSDRGDRQKLYAALMRKGFSYRSITRHLNSL